jgi:hypothetical protein
VGGLAVLPAAATAKGEEAASAARPTWLEELSRKQANRRSGIFPEERKPDLLPEPPGDQKPSLPSKPSEARKSLGSFSKRPSNLADKTAAVK